MAAVIFALSGDAAAQSPPPALAPPAPGPPMQAPPLAPGLASPPPMQALPPGVPQAPYVAPGYAPPPPWAGAPAQPYWPTYAPAYPPSPSLYPPDVPFSLPPATPKEAANRPLMMTGIVAAVGGVVTLIAGSVIMSVAKDRIDVYRDGPAYCCSIDDAPLRNAGITLLVVGGITAAIGVPLWMIGGRRVPVRKETTTTPDATSPKPRVPASVAPLLRVGATGASLSWQF